MRGAILALSVILTLPPAAAQAQRLDPPTFPVDEGGRQRPAVASIRVPTARGPLILGLGGIAGGGLGAMAGGWTGARIREHACEDCGLNGLLYGAVVGVSTALPVGVHFANGGRGKLGPSLLASLALGGAGLAAAALTHEYGILMAVPVAQLVSSVAIERATSR